MIVMPASARSVGAGFRGKRGLMPMNLRTQLPGHLDDDMVVPDSQDAVRQDLDGDVAVADVPGDSGSLGGFAATQVCDRFRRRDDPHIPAVLQHQAIALTEAHCLGQVQQKRFSFIGDEPDPAPVAAAVVQSDRGTLPFDRPLVCRNDRGCARQHQNRK